MTARLAIATAGSARLGLGHCLRGATIARAASALADVALFVRGDAAALRAAARELGRTRIAVHGVAERAPQWEQSGALDADALVVDDPGDVAPLVDAAIARGLGCVVLDRLDLAARAHATVVPSPLAFAPDVGVDPARVRSGAAWCVVEPRERGLDAPPWPGARDSVLVAFGGADPEACTEPVARALAARAGLAERGLRVEAIVGPASALAARMRDASPARGEHGGVHWLVAPSRAGVYAAMQRARVAVCAFGTGLYELAALGTPALVATRGARDAAIARSLATLGIGRPIGDAAALDAAAVAREVECALDAEWARAAAARGAAALGDGRGARRIAELAFAHAGRPVPAPAPSRAEAAHALASGGAPPRPLASPDSVAPRARRASEGRP